MPFKDIAAGLSDNPYFGAGFGLAGLGVGVAFLRKGAQVGVTVARRFLTVSLEVPSKDKSYQWLLQWITAQAAKRSQHLSVNTTYSQASESGKVSTQFDFMPSPGIHFFEYKGRWIRVERTREQQAMDFSQGAPWESVTLQTFGTFTTKHIFNDMLGEARNLALSKQEGKTPIYVAMGAEWRPFGFPRKKRPIESVVLDRGVSEKLQCDVFDFLQSPSWYADRGIPYRRGYLLYGPPGCGKSSFIQALAGELDYGICIMNLSDRGLTDDRLNHLLNIAPEQSIILLEDIDAAFVTASADEETAEHPIRKMAYEGLSRLTFSGLLNALDGVASSEARLLFMTTNHINRLDPALIRPGRVDMQQFVGYASQDQISRMFMRFYPEAGKEECCRFVEKLLRVNPSVSAAQLQAHFLMYKEFSNDVIENVEYFKGRHSEYVQNDDPIVLSAAK